MFLPRVTHNDVEGFFITPSGKKYETLKEENIVFLALNEKYDFTLKCLIHGLNPSSEWRFHQDIYLKKPKRLKLLSMLIHLMQQQFQPTENQFLHFII